MSSPRIKSASALFTKADLEEYAQYLQQPCDCHGDSYVFSREYPPWIISFMKLSNKRPPQYAIVRTVLRRLRERNALPRCQMTRICDYICAARAVSIEDQQATEYISRIETSKDRLVRALGQLNYVRKAIDKEQSSESDASRSLIENMDSIQILQLAEDCLRSSIEIKSRQNDSFSIRRKRGHLFALRKVAFDLIFEYQHSDRHNATVSDISFIIPVLHEAIHRQPPNRTAKSEYQSEKDQYSIENLLKEKKRLNKAPTRRKLEEIMRQCQGYLPGLRERIQTESLKELRLELRAPQVPTSRRCADIIKFSEIYAGLVRDRSNDA